MQMLNKLKPHTLAMVEDLKLDATTFLAVLRENVVLITKALQNHMIIPAFETFCDNITEIYEKVVPLTEIPNYMQALVITSISPDFYFAKQLRSSSQKVHFGSS